MGQLCSGGAAQENQPQPQPSQRQQQQQQQRGGGGGTGSAPLHSNGGPTFGGPREWPPASSAGDAKRFEASVHAKRRGELLSQSQAAWQAGDKAKAKQLSEEGKREGALMEAANLAACEAYFAGNNSKRGLGEIDLHGLHVDEAMRKLEERLGQCKAQRAEQLVVIVGRGNHSKDGVKIRPAMEKMLREHQLRVAVDSPNQGCLTIMFGAGQAGFVQAPGAAKHDSCVHQ